MTNKFSLLHKEDLYDLIWEKGLAGLAIVSKDGHFQRANPSFCNIVEYNELELQDMRVRDVSLPSDASVSLALSQEVAEGNSEGFDMFKGFVTKTNKVVHVHMRVLPFIQDDKVYYLVGQVYPLPPDSNHRIASPTDINKNKIDWKKIFTALSYVGGVGGAILVGIGYIIKEIG